MNDERGRKIDGGDDEEIWVSGGGRKIAGYGSVGDRQILKGRRPPPSSQSLLMPLN